MWFRLSREQHSDMPDPRRQLREMGRWECNVHRSKPWGSLCTESFIGYTYKKHRDWMLECENNAQCWTKRDEDKLDSFQHKCLRKILKINLPMKVTNEEVRKRKGSERLSTQIRTRRWTWIGHVLRMKPDSLPRTALNWAPEGKRKRGRPRETWRRTVEKERSQMGFKAWTEATRTAIDRKR